jgi:hypothetical protein
MNENSGRSHAKVVVGPESGYVFIGEAVEVLCFVPDSLVSFHPDGEVRIDYLRYVTAGWSRRNLRWADAAVGGQHVFPDSRRPVSGTAPEVDCQAERWRNLARASVAFSG